MKSFTSASFKPSFLLTVLYFGMVYGFAACLPLAAENNGNGIGAIDDSLVIHSVYFYRQISVQYDSMVAACLWGEMVATQNGQDTLTIQPSPYVAPPGDDGQAYDISTSAKSRTFYVTTSSELSIFRALLTKRISKSVPYFLPDTCTWTLELWSATQDVKLATLDSVGFYPGLSPNTNNVPESFGAINTAGGNFDRLQFQLEDYLIPGSGSDSVYLRYRVAHSGTQEADKCNLYDQDLVNAKFSEDLSYEKSSIGAASVDKARDFKITLSPNPASSWSRLYIGPRQPETVTVNLADEQGKLIKRIWSGQSGSHTQVVTVHVADVPSGHYFLLVRGGISGHTSTHRLSVVH